VAAAQTNTGEVAGTVMDESGGVLPGATVTATHPASGTVATRVTDAEGRFFLPALRVGTWDLTVVLPGFVSQTRRRRSGPISCAIRSWRAISGHPIAGSIPARSRCKRPSPSAAHRETASSVRATRTWTWHSRRPGG